MESISLILWLSPLLSLSSLPLSLSFSSSLLSPFSLSLPVTPSSYCNARPSFRVLDHQKGRGFPSILSPLSLLAPLSSPSPLSLSSLPLSPSLSSLSRNDELAAMNQAFLPTFLLLLHFHPPTNQTVRMEVKNVKN